MKTTTLHTIKHLALAPLLMASLALLAPSLLLAPAAAHPIVKSAPGTYELSFLTHNNQPIPESTLFVGEELVLKAHVEDSFQSPALRGSVTFQVCSRRGGRSLFQMDPAPSRECDVEGTGTWISLITMKVDAGTCPGAGPGNACVNFGYISSPRTIGFRFRYAEQGSGIASAISQPKDASWVLP
jgi:hypothetical protein